MKLEFHGANLGVTGSCHLVECAGKRVLIDCGLYQGGYEQEDENGKAFGFDAGSIDYVLLTHAHLDHCGRLPLLAKRGFRGEIITTAASRELARLVMLDSAHLQEEDARWRARRAGRHDDKATVGPLYTTLDALNTQEFFGRTAVYDRPIEVAPGIRATYIDAGHILGSACILLELSEGGVSRRLLFSGDLGSSGRPIMRDPAPPPQVDIVIMESTYGDRRHKPLGPSIEELYAAIEAALDRGGNVVIPTFALERAQELLYHLRVATESRRLPRRLPVYLDSPMAISATEIFRNHPECYDAEASELFRDGRDPFDMPGLRFTHEAAESMALNRIAGGAVIMAGSGMCTGGRVRHHLKHNLWRKDSAIVFVGYAARGTPARRIIDGAKTLKLFGDEIRVQASIHTINGFSAHADQAELLAWHAHTKAKRTFLVHGELDPMQTLAGRLTNTAVEMPAPHQAFAL